ncbi:MAG: FMN-binding protein [Prevotella sp.]|nr:FMN-binding protein [Prevotella sp.]
MNTNSNAYIIIYSTILVLIVAFLLAFVSQTLKPMQDKNVELDRQKQILYSLNLADTVKGASDEQVIALYQAVVAPETDSLGIYTATVNGDTIYVLPLKGQGMWGGISCFLAVESDRNTIYGAYFNHESETAGLGAEIKDNAQWQAKFQGKQIFIGDSLALSVEKNVNNETTVDAVTGATVTSTAVSKMLQDQLQKKYMDFLKKEE